VRRGTTEECDGFIGQRITAEFNPYNPIFQSTIIVWACWKQ